VATSDRRVPGWLESRKNLTGSGLAVVGLGLHFAGLTGSLWPVVVPALYAAGALIAPPERPPAPAFPTPEEQLSALRADLATLRDYLATAQVAERFDAVLQLLTGLLDPAGDDHVAATDPEALHTLARITRQDVPEAVDAYLRARWWNRLTPGTEPPERHLDRQAALLAAEAAQLVAALREREADRQQSHTRYLEQRSPESGQGQGT
jgi:hypothetical protein